MDSKNSGVYAITNIKTGSQYVGSAVDIRMRWRAHKHSLRHHKKSPPKLQAAWDKYGEDSFAFAVLELCDKDQCTTVEQKYIDSLKPKYNTRVEAKSNFGVKWSAETNAKKGRPENAYTVKGVTGGLHTLCKHFGIVTKQCAQWRITERGMSVEDAVLTPSTPKSERGKISAVSRKENNTGFKGANLTFRGCTGSVTMLTEKFGVVDYYAVRSRMQRGWSLEKALLTPKRERT
jgi:group I intron endonuclease